MLKIHHKTGERSAKFIALLAIVSIWAGCAKESAAPAELNAESIPASNDTRAVGDPFITNVGTTHVKYLVFDDQCNQVGLLYTHVGQGPVRYLTCANPNTFRVRDWMGNMVGFTLGHRYIVEAYASNLLDRMWIAFYDINAGIAFDPCSGTEPEWQVDASAPCIWTYVPGSVAGDHESIFCQNPMLGGC